MEHQAGHPAPLYRLIKKQNRCAAHFRAVHRFFASPAPLSRPDLVHRSRIQWVCGLLRTKSLPRRRLFSDRIWCTGCAFNGFADFFAPNPFPAGAFFPSGLGAPPTNSVGLWASLHQVPASPALFSRPDLVHRPRIQWVCGFRCTKFLPRRRLFPVRTWCTAYAFNRFAGFFAPSLFLAGATAKAEKRILTALRGEYTLSILLFLKKQPYKYRSSGWLSTFSGTSDVFSATASAFFGAGVSPTFRFLCRRTRNPIMSAKSTRITPMAMVARLEI